MNLRPLLAVLFLTTLQVSGAAPPSLDTGRLDRILGTPGTWNQAEQVYKVAVPRTDVPVMVDGWRLPPFMGLSSWVAFQGTGERATMMGDLALFEDEVNPVLSALLDGGAEVTALHNHFFHDQPNLFFMHVGGQGDPATLGGAVRRALDLIRGIRARRKDPVDRQGRTPPPAKSDLDATALARILGVPGQTQDGMFKAVFGRTARHGGMPISSQMGVNTWAAFAGSDEQAVVDGDFAMRESELQGVLKGLRRASIAVVAIHHHMTGEEPRILFLHYWGVGRTEDLARGLKAALEQTKHE